MPCPMKANAGWYNAPLRNGGVLSCGENVVLATIELTPLSTMLRITAPFWIPFLFAAYALGKKKVTLQFLFIALTTEALAMGVCWRKVWFN